MTLFLAAPEHPDPLRLRLRGHRRRGHPRVLQLLRARVAVARRAGPDPGAQRLRPGPGRRRDRRQPRPRPRHGCRAPGCSTGCRTTCATRCRAATAPTWSSTPSPAPRDPVGIDAGDRRPVLRLDADGPRDHRPHPRELRPLRARVRGGGRADVPARLPRRDPTRPAAGPSRLRRPGSRSAAARCGVPEAQLPPRPRRGPRRAAPSTTSPDSRSTASATPTATGSSTTSTPTSTRPPPSYRRFPPAAVGPSGPRTRPSPSSARDCGRPRPPRSAARASASRPR